MKFSVKLFFSSFIIIASIVSCASSGRQSGAEQMAGPTSEPMYYGYGEGGSDSSAMNMAKADAVRLATEDLLEPAVSTAKASEIDALFNTITDFSVFTFNPTMVIIDKTVLGNNHSFRLGIRIDLVALSNFLRRAGIYGGLVTPAAGEDPALADMPAPSEYTAEADSGSSTGTESMPNNTTSSSPAGSNPFVSLTSEQSAFINSYIADLTYMVYYDDDSQDESNEVLQAAISSANRYLSREGFRYIDLGQIESLKESQQMIYEDSTGQSVSILQWLAAELNADIYIEVSVSTTSSTQARGRYNGSATVTLNNYESATAEGRGAATYQTNPPAFSTVSEQDAVMNAVTSSVFQAMPVALENARNQQSQALARGVRYALVIQNTQDSRIMRGFEQQLRRRVSRFNRLSFSPEETSYEIFMFGDQYALEDLVYTIAESIPELEGMVLVVQRRNSLTFDTGM